MQETETRAAPAEAPDRSFRHTVERRGGSTAVIAVEVDAARLSAAADRAFSRHVQRAKIPGFRPGKAPRAIYERTYGSEHLWEDAAEDVVDETFREIVQLEGLVPLTVPQVEVTKLEPGQPFTYTATVPVRPDVELGDYQSHGATVEPTPLTAEDVERVIAGMREHHAELRPVDREARTGDVLTVDVDVELDGRQMPPFGRDAHLELGREYAVPGLAEGLVGVRAGEHRTLELTFPDDHPDDDVKGKTGRFSVHVSQVAEKILPDAGDDFAKTVGVGGMEELEHAVRSDLAHRAFHEARDAASEKVLAHLIDTSSVEVPDVLVEDELDHMVADLKERIAQQGATFEQFLLQARTTDEEIRKDWRPAAERRAKSLLVLDAVAKKEGVTVSSAELAQEVALMPAAQQDPEMLRRPEVLASIARSMRNRKLMDKLIGLEGADAERELIVKAGGPEDAADPHAAPDEDQELVVPDAPASSATAEGREAIRALARGEQKEP